MKSSELGWLIRSTRRVSSVMAIVAVAVFLTPGPAPAVQKPHANDPVNAYWSTITPGGNGCSDCHSLQASQGDTATSYISVNARTLGAIRTITSGVIPANLGCTFCHDRTTSPAKMKGALVGHFDAQRSQHPVGRTYVGGYADTQNEYLSSYLSNTTNEMDCLDCHDPAQVAPSGYYMAHNPTNETTNPYMLKANGIAGVTVAAAGQYDAFCRDCHGTSAAANWKSKGKDIRLVSHKDGRDASAAYAIAEQDGTLLLTTDVAKDGTADARTNQCTDCHGKHSAPNAKLFVSAFSSVNGPGSDCTSLCHLRGDRYDNYDKHGHGKTDLSTYQYGGMKMDMALPCVDCHVAIDTTTSNIPGTRKPHAEKLAINGNRDNYKANFNLSKNVNSTDPGTPTGNPQWGICFSCHSAVLYSSHMSYEGNPTGCQDCHDEHGEGSGITSNVFMIPESSKKTGFFKAITKTPAGTEQVRYVTPFFLADRTTPSGGPYDFYRADGFGSCDNTECHGISYVAGATGHPGPMNVFMTGSRHSGGDQLPGVDCYKCHTHNDPQGGWGASAACDDCHGTAAFPNTTGIARTHTDANESLTFHTLHAASPMISGCTECHPHDGKTVSAGTPPHMDGTVTFGGTRLTTALNYSASGMTSINCTSANGCHNADDNEWKLGLNGTIADSCADCHAATGKTLDQGGYPAPNVTSATKHTAHINNNVYVPLDCDNCHGTGATLGTHAGHKNGIRATAATATLSSYTSASKTCDTTCHLANTANDWTNAGVLACVDCHAGSYIGGGAYRPLSGLHAVTATNVQKHDETLAAGNCVNCHATTAAAPASHINGVWQADAAGNTEGRFVVRTGMTYTELAPNSSTCFAPSPATGLDGCHRDSGEWARLWSTDADLDYVANPNPAQAVCNVCHGQYSTLANSTGWRQGTSHYRAGAAGATEDKGIIHTDPAPASCEDCHAYSSNVVHDSDSKINFSDGTPTSYTATYAASPNRWYCLNCHSGASAEDPTLTTTRTFPDSLAFPGIANTTHTNGVSEPSGCSACHGDSANAFWPQNATTARTGYPNRAGRHLKHMEVLGQRRYAKAAAALTSAEQQAICDMCHNDPTGPAGTTGHYPASYTNADAPADLNTAANQPFDQMWGAYAADANGAYTAATYGASPTFAWAGASTCANVDCHNNKTNPAGYEWYNTTQTGCVMCHLDVAAETTHTSHTGAGASYGFNITCAACHTTALVFGSPGTAPATNHINGAFTVTGNGTFTFSYTGVYPTKGTCGTNDCHRSDAGTGAPNSGAYTWGVTVLANNCEQCHRGATIATNKHQAHLISNALPPAGAEIASCYACHNTTATAGGLATGAGHLNKAVDMSFNATYNYEAATAARNGALVGAQTSCANVRCHNGVITPQWSLTIGCGQCHNTTANGPLPSAASVAGKHASHANNDATYTDCAACHPNAATYTAIGGHADHQNLLVTLTMTGITYADTNGVGGANYVNGTETPDYDNGTCTSTTGCHGTGAPSWATAATLANGCFDCHGGLTATETVATKPLVDTIPNPVNLPQYNSQGHGQAGPFSGSLTTGPGFTYGSVPGCYNCHDTNATHAPAASATDPFRLGAYATNTDGLCAKAAGCHTNPAENQTHKQSLVALNGNWFSYDFKCVDCHDPHGDGNYYMIRTSISAPTTTGETNLTFGSDSYGTPRDTANASLITFTNLGGGNTANSYGINGTGNGLCEVCHVDTTNVTYYRRGQADTNTHNPTGKCTACHKHNEGFKPSGCDGCHGSQGTGQFWPDGTPALPAYADDNAGAHQKHVDAIGAARGWTTPTQKNGTCDWCHANPGGVRPGTYTGSPESGHDFNSLSDSRADVIGDGRVTAGDVTFYNNATTRVVDADGSYNAVSKTCSNIDCHGGAVTPSWSFVPDVTAPVFSPNNTITVTNPVSDGDLQISWNTATDAGTPPVSYDLYRLNNNTTGNACTDVARISVATDLGTTAYLDTGLTNGTNYRYCVVAKDSVTPTPNTTNTTSAHAAPTSAGGGCGSPTNTTYYTLFVDPPTTNDGGTNPAASATTYDLDNNGYGRKAMQTVTGTASRIYYEWQTQNTSFRRYSRFYIDLTGDSCVGNGGNITITSGIRANNAANQAYFTLLDHDPAGAADNGVVLGTSNTVTTNNIAATVGYTFTIPTMAAQPILDSHYLVLEFWYMSGNSATANRLYVGGNTSTTGTYFTIPLATGSPTDSTAPAFAGNNSNITAADATTGGAANLTWSAATDAFPSNPVRYTVYGVQSAAAPAAGVLFIAGNIKQNNVLGTSTTVTGLAVGNPWWFGVRATDSADNVETANTTISTPGVTPTGGGGGGGPLTCTSCHDSAPATGAHQKHANNDAVYTDCDRCHGNATYSISPAAGGYTTSGPSGLHNNGSVDMYFLRIPGETATAAYNGGASPGDTCVNINCHSNTTTPSWTTGSTTCASCHGYPPTTGTNHGATTGGGAIGVTRLMAAHNDCEYCHGIRGNLAYPLVATTMGTPVDKTADGGDAYVIATNHANTRVTMNGITALDNGQNTDYREASAGCFNACHASSYVFTSVQANTVELLELGAGACSACHDDGGTSGAPQINAASSHVDADGAGATYTAGNCGDCHPFHSGGVQIPNNTGVGINYSTTGHAGIVLGGTATSGATEAEICWNCHNTKGISEWGTNTKLETGSSVYNYGTVTTPNWTTATWTSGTALFSYKTAAIASTHAATTSTGAGTTTRKGVDDVATIRCSYCHDVHNRNLAPGDTTSGQPYLRGSWRGNPYPEDGAPRTGSTYPAANNTTNPWGPVPRGGAANGTATGGFFIDQNSGNPVITNAWTATQFGGLCDLCHGTTKNGAFVAAEIDALNQYDAAGVGWVSALNGHSNSVEGGTDSTLAARNIFAGRGGATNQYTKNTGDHPFMNYSGTLPGSLPADTGSGSGFRNGSRNGTWMLLPDTIADPGDGKGWDDTQWNKLTTPAARNLDKTGATVNSNYHTFSCSKCHNPHASRLPALMITNCLDTKHNAWDNDFNNPDHPTTDTVNAGRSLSNWSSAQNCHRLGGNDPDDANDTAANTATAGNKGWNTVTPW